MSGKRVVADPAVLSSIGRYFHGYPFEIGRSRTRCGFGKLSAAIARRCRFRLRRLFEAATLRTGLPSECSICGVPFNIECPPIARSLERRHQSYGGVFLPRLLEPLCPSLRGFCICLLAPRICGRKSRRHPCPSFYWYICYLGNMLHTARIPTRAPRWQYLFTSSSSSRSGPDCCFPLSVIG